MMHRKFFSVLAAMCLCCCMHAQFDVRVNRFIQDDLRKGAPFYSIGDVTRFVPGTMHMGLGVAGVPARHAFVDRAIEATIAYTCALSVGFLLKFTVVRERPDMSDSQSFPSGHTLFAFTGAELTRMDYGWGWGGGAYAVAALTGAERLWGNKHWLTDVLAGAGIGILSAQAGCWLLQPVKELFGIPELDWDGFGTGKVRIAAAPCVNPLCRTYTAAVAIRF